MDFVILGVLAAYKGGCTEATLVVNKENPLNETGVSYKGKKEECVFMWKGEGMVLSMTCKLYEQNYSTSLNYRDATMFNITTFLNSTSFCRIWDTKPFTTFISENHGRWTFGRAWSTVTRPSCW